MYRTTLLFLLILAFTACNKNKKNNDILYCERQCSSWIIYPYFTGFNETEIKTVIVKTYESGSNFSKLLNEKTYNDPFTNSPANNSDFKGQGMYISTGGDYEIILPDADTTYRIAIEEQAKSITAPCNRLSRCYNTVLSSKLNDNAITLHRFNEGWMDLQLAK